MSGTQTADTGTSIDGIWVVERGREHRALGTVLLIAGLGDPAEAWGAQLESLQARHHVVAFDNRGVGRSALPPTTLTVPSMADDAAAVLDALGVGRARVVGFSGGGLVAQELALRHPQRVESLVLVGTFAELDPYGAAMIRAWTWMAERAPDARSFLEAFYLWIYTARAHADGMVAGFIDEALAFEPQQSPEGFAAQLVAFTTHSTLDRLGAIDVPTLVVTGSDDRACPPRHGRRIAEAVAGARFVLLEGEAHQPFQERPAEFDALVEAFWAEH
jgi:pimeloyl-ACP methyl ester carboxylesterase